MIEAVVSAILEGVVLLVHAAFWLIVAFYVGVIVCAAASNLLTFLTRRSTG